MQGINRGPEIIGGENLHYEYSRSEREKLSKFTDGRRSEKSKSNKILLLDLVILFIICGIVIPFVYRFNNEGSINNLNFKLEQRLIGDKLLISLIIEPYKSFDPNIEGMIQIEASVDEQDVILRTVTTPFESENIIERFQFQGGEKSGKVKIHIKWSGKELKLNANTLSM